MTDVFREVDEELKRDKFERAIRENIPWVIGTFIAMVAAASIGVGVRGWINKRAETRTAALVQAVDATGTEALRAQIDAAAGDYKRLGQLQLAGRLAAEQPDAAATAFDAAAGNGALGELALVLGALNKLDTAPPDSIIAEMKPLTDAGNPWHGSALEITALALVRAGKPAEAAAIFGQLAKDASVPEGIRARAERLTRYYSQRSEG